MTNVRHVIVCVEVAPAAIIEQILHFTADDFERFFVAECKVVTGHLVAEPECFLSIHETTSLSML